MSRTVYRAHMKGTRTPEYRAQLQSEDSMNHKKPEGLDMSTAVVAPEQPAVWEVETNDSVFVKQIHMVKAGTLIPQHSHPYSHSSLLAIGSVRLWKDGVLVGDYEAPQILSIDAGVKHLFQSLVDNTIVYCIHNLSHSGTYEILEEHHLLGGDHEHSTDS